MCVFYLGALLMPSTFSLSNNEINAHSLSLSHFLSHVFLVQCARALSAKESRRERVCVCVFECDSQGEKGRGNGIRSVRVCVSDCKAQQQGEREEKVNTDGPVKAQSVSF